MSPSRKDRIGKGKNRRPPQVRPREWSPRGFLGAGGGRWRAVPTPPAWFSTSVQVCGIYPFGAGAARPTAGAPLGQDLLTGMWIAADPDMLFRNGVISSPSMIMMGINGVGKSSTLQTMMAGMIARGITPAMFDPIKGEHAEFIRSMGGTVFSVGPQGDRLNLLDRGPLGDAAERIGGRVGAELLELAQQKAVDQVRLVTAISRRSQLEDIEGAVLEAMVITIMTTWENPRTRDLVRMFDNPSPEVLAIAGYEKAEGFHARFQRLGESLRAMMTGELGTLLGGDKTVRVNAANPGGFCFDTSAIPESKTQLLSAAMMCCWSLGMDAIDAHWEIAQHEAGLAKEAAARGESYTPKVTWGGYCTAFDEFWFPMRAVEGIVPMLDRLSRTNRSKGTAEIKVTHSPKDLQSLPNPADIPAAMGLIERSGLLLLMALTRRDLEVISGVRHLTTEEISMVAGFNAAKDWGEQEGGADVFEARTPTIQPPPEIAYDASWRTVARNGRAWARERTSGLRAQTAPSGAGKILLKVSGRVGIPVQMVKPATQAALHVTDERYRS
jgi:hypothetical protein